MQFTQIKETCLYTTDLERAEAFYTQKLGLECFAKMEGRHVFFRAGTSVLLIFNPEATAKEERLPPHDGFGRIHMAFEVQVEDYEKSKQTLMDRGVIITHEEHWKNGRRSFYFEDPDGHVLEIVEKGMWDPST